MDEFTKRKMMRLGDDIDLNDLKDKERYITYRKQSSRILNSATQKAKKRYCLYCKNEVSSFCNSHSIPKFILQEIAQKMVIYVAKCL